MKWSASQQTDIVILAVTVVCDVQVEARTTSSYVAGTSEHL
jgi:hypothetical protein